MTQEEKIKFLKKWYDKLVSILHLNQIKLKLEIYENTENSCMGFCRLFHDINKYEIHINISHKESNTKSELLKTLIHEFIHITQRDLLIVTDKLDDDKIETKLIDGGIEKSTEYMVDIIYDLLNKDF